ncbi:MAG TPA: (Fe-S)-binding protein [Candidatus Moranbacteria bacterium]|nr:(Fe-S)-binding protein [Candidatus Moranbacteria bacterium]
MGFLNKLFAGNTLYYPGCLTKFATKDLVENYKQILKWEGIDFIMLKDKEVCCGSPIKNAGSKQVFSELAQKNKKIFEEHGIRRIVSNCPGCVATFRNDYSKLLGESWKIEVLHITEIINKSLTKLKKVQPETKATYHDPCHLGRRLGIYEQPRKIIQAAGYDLVEMELNREDSFCCGGGGGVSANNQGLAKRVAEDRISQAVQTEARVLITACSMCMAHLKNNQGEKMEVIDISHLFDF